MAASRGLVGRVPRVLAGVLAAAIGALLALQLRFLGQVVRLEWNDPGSTEFMRAQHDALRRQDRGAELSHRWVPYERISPHLKRAVIAAEDANFIGHDGVDRKAIERAHERNVKRGRLTHGGSTITMQRAGARFSTFRRRRGGAAPARPPRMRGIRSHRSPAGLRPNVNTTSAFALRAALRD